MNKNIKRKISNTKIQAKGKIKNKVQNSKMKSSSFKQMIDKKITNKNGKKNIWKLVLLIFILFVIAMLLLGIIFFAYIVISAPKFTTSKLYATQSSILYDDDGNEFYRLGEQNRQIITYDQLSESLVDAIVATEDSRFFQHNGFDLPRFMVASLKQVTGHGGGGASTLTMQVSKNTFTSTEAHGIQGIVRKFQDIYISIFKIEKKYTKEEIMEFYVNSNYMGGTAWGVETASLQYFQKHASELNIAESALLAGIFNAPDYYNPIKNPENAEERRQTVLYLMKRHGYITKDEYDAAMKLTVEDLLNVKEAEVTDRSKYLSFVNTVVEEVIDKTGNNPYKVPMKIYTTMNKSQQEYIDKLYNGELGFEFRDDYVQAGIAVVDVEDGSLSAIGAGRNQTERGFNYATMLKRQIGSTAKPLYDYGPAIEYNGYSTGEPIVDEPWSYSDNSMGVSNITGTFYGIVSARTALKMSLNIPALKTFQAVENKNIYEFVTNLGLSPEVSEGSTLVHEAHAIGGYNGESPKSMAAAYAAFANGGYYTEPYSFKKIEYIEGNEDFVYKPTKKKAMSEETAYMVMDMLITNARYYGCYANGVTFGAKTGSTNLDYETRKKLGLPSSTVPDSWEMGISGKYTIGLWYGYDEISTEHYITTGTTQRNTIFGYLTRGLFKENKTFTMPSGVTKVEVETGGTELLLPSQYTPSGYRSTELFVKGTEPSKVSTRFSKLSNVTDLNASTSNGETTLTWSPIETPDAIDSNYLTGYYAKAFKNEACRNKYLNQRLAYNRNSIGSLVYKVYVQDGEDLNYLGETSDNTYTFNAIGGTNTIVVKTSYTIFTANASDGESIDVTAKGSNVSLGLIKNSIDTTVGKYVDYKQLVNATENGNIINNFTITTDDSKVNYNVPGTYTANITVKYKSLTKNYPVTVNVK